MCITSHHQLVVAGGIADGRGLVAALALGAEGVACGTAFLLSPECGIYVLDYNHSPSRHR